MLNCTAQPEHMPSASRPHRASCLGNEGCAAFKCLVHLWEWLDPPTLITSPSMDSNKGQPTTQQPLQQRSVQHLHANPLPALAVRLNSPQPAQLPTNGIVHQLLMQSPGYHQHSSTISQDARTPLLENTHELYGTQHLSDYVKPRQYGTRERENLYSPQTPQSSQSQLPINYDSRNINSAAHAVPLGYNVDVHNAYLLRNPPKEQNQIYQNHQGLYRSPEIDGSNIYTPYTSRLQAPAPSNTEMLKQQYNEIQQMRLQQQMHYQNRAQMHQQQIFAQRQLLLQHMHGVQPPPNLRQDLELIPSKEVEGNRNKKLHDISLGEKESYRQDEFYGKNPSLEKEQSNRKDQLKVKEQTYLREPTFSHKEQGIDTINSQRQQLQRESRERDRYQMQGQQISPPSSKSPESTNPSIKSPSSESRRSSAGTQALRSPTAQRPASAPVTMSGWLYKQGSDGLKVWRKRWFVLSEYCLFYYKSQDEDKLLGSVLLPSYVVRACGADERVSRRYAFKCEHVNMRTLLLAAPDEALKQAWLRALTCAALMQEGSLHEQTNTSNEEVREYGQENDNEMSEEDGSPGHTYANAPPKPRRSNDGYNSPSPERYESNYDLLRKPPSTYNQSIRTPTQAENIYDKQPQENYSGSAPRQTYQNKLNSGPSSSAAETLQISRSYEQQSNQYTDDREDAKSPIYFDDMKTSTYNSITDNRNTERSQGLRQLPDQSILRDLTNWNIYESRNPDTEDSYKRTPDESTYGSRPVHELSYKSVTNDNLSDISQSRLDIRNDNVHVMNNEVDKVPYYDAGNNTTSERIERRTPDAYGRSAITPSYNNNGKCSDYEDIYPKYPAGKEYRTSYKTSENSNVYDERGTKNNEGYAQNIYERNILSPTQGVHYVPSVLRRAKAQTVNSQAEGVLRPHSADFLQHEYPASRPSHPTQSSRSTQRPKSSLDINSYYDPSSDSYYSEESYAAKMRQSAQYLHSSGPAASAVAARLNTPLPLLNLNDDKQYTAPDSYATNNTSRSDVRSFANTSNYLDKDNVSYDSSKFADSSSLNSNWTLKDNRKLSLENEICNRSNSTTGDSLKVGENALGGDCFVRSASARLSSDIQEYNKDEEKKVHQREESMKRLLEWKQRMLLSPLTRKSTPAALTLARTLHRHTALPQHQEQTADIAQSRPSEQAGRPPDPPLTLSASSTISPRHKNLPTDLHNKNEPTFVHIIPASDILEAETTRIENGLHVCESETNTETPNSKPHTKNELLDSRLSMEKLLKDDCTIKTLGKAPFTNEGENSIYNTNKDLIGSQVQPLQKLDDIPVTSDLNYEKKLSQNFEDTKHMCKDEDRVQIPMENETESATDMEYTDDDLDEVLMNSDEENRPAVESETIQVIGTKIQPAESQEKNYRRSSEDINATNVVNNVVTESISHSEETVPKITMTTSVPLPLEDHYLPMTPRKASHTNNSFNSFTSVFESGYTGGHEDNNYVEMSQGMAVDNVFGHDAYEVVCINNNGRVEPVYMELTTPDQLRDVVSDLQIPPEPPEPNQKDIRSSNLNLSKTNSIDRSTLKRENKPKRDESLKSPLPDILLNSNKSILKSDSSDADDEASKDFSIDRPFSRFSLSDTFRPASYYLGSSRTLQEFHDSSDNEIVRPPLAPASSPPAEELESVSTLVHKQLNEEGSTSAMENKFGYSKFDTIKKKTTSLMIYGSTPSVHDTLFRGEKIRRSRASLTNDSKIKVNIESPSPNNALFKSCSSLDAESIISYNADRCSSKMSLDSDISSKFDANTSNIISSADILSWNHASVSTSTTEEELERISKRRPLMDESFLEVDKYLGILQSTDFTMLGIDGSFVDNTVRCYDAIKLDSDAVGYYNKRVAAIREERQYENINIQESLNIRHSRSASNPVTSSRTPPLRPLSSCSANSSSSNIKNTSKVMTENHQMLDQDKYCGFVNPNTEQIPMSYYSKSAMQDNEIIEKNLNKHNSNGGTLNKVKTASFEQTILKTSPERIPTEQNVNSSVDCKISDISHSRDSSTDHSAPYYYSDLSSQEHVDIISTPHYTKNNNLNKKLNNQRMCKGAFRKNEIMHIHNQIHSNLVTNQLHGLNDESFSIAAAARSVSVEFLSAADKTAEINMKNIYESDTIRRQKNRDSSSSLHVSPNSKNEHPHVTDNNNLLSVSRIANNSSESNQSFDFSFNDSRVSSVRNDSSHKKSESPNKSSSEIDGYYDLLTRSSSDACSAVEELNTLLTGQQESEQERYVKSENRCEADNLWDEDTLWKENLRRASQRHARSMDNLDCLSNSDHVSGRFSVDLKSMNGSRKTSKSIKAKSAKINRMVTYVNDDTHKADTSKRKFYENRVAEVQSENKQNDNDVYVKLVSEVFDSGPIRDVPDEGVYEQLAIQAAINKSIANIASESHENSISFSEIKTSNEVKLADRIKASEGQKKRFEIDREKLRQWDLMSSGLMKNEWYKVGGSGGVGGLSAGNAGQMDHESHVDDREGANHGGHMDLKSGVRGNADRAGCSGKIDCEAILTGNEAASGHRQLQIANKKSLGGSNPSINRPARDAIPIRAVSPRVRWATEKPSRNQGQEDAWNSGRDANVVEGEVGVGQGVPWAMAGVGGACALLGRSHVELQELLRDLRERHAVHATVVHRTNQQIRHLQSVLGTPEFLENRQEKLEQLEKLKLHLVELERQYSASRPLMQLVDSMVRLGALYPRAGHVQPATLDRLERNTHARHQLLLDQAQEQRRLAESTESLSREQIQRKMEQLWALDRELSSETGTLQELKADKETIEKVLGGVRDKMDASQSESDAEVKLAHVYSMLAHNSKKLEQTVGDNARLERELAALRDSLQGHTTHRTTALLEDELRRVRQLVFELQRQRQELSSAVRRLTESANLVAATPTGSLYKKRISNMSWLETDLDSGRCVEHGAEEEILTPPAYLLSAQNQSTAWMSSSQDSRQQMMPLYVDTRPTEPDMESVLSPTTSDDGTQNGFGNMTNVEKQEIKTVRIVKRESERRHRDRDRSLQPYPCDWGPMDLNLPMSHDEHYARAASLPRTANSTVQPLHAPASAMGLSMSNKTHPPSHLSLSNVNVPQNMASTWQYENAKYQSSPTLPIDNKNSSWYGSSQMTQSYNGYMPASSRHANITGTTKPSGYGDSALHRNRTSTSSVPAALSGGANSGSVASLSSSVSALSPPTFSSEAARQIMSEVREVREVPTGARRVVPRERRRHHTAPLRLSTDALQQLPKSDGFLYNEKKSSGRWLDDTDMERALRGRGRDEMSVTDATGVTGQDRPDVVRCSAPPVAKLTDAALIDQLLFAPRKILIPERYIPEKPAELSHEEQQKRLEKVESIKKMLSSGASTSDPAKQSPGGDEKKQRQHLLHMNQILAQQVMEMSKIVAGSSGEQPSSSNHHKAKD